MANCKIETGNNSNSGLITKIWGPPGWTFLHAITFGYPLNPTDQQKKQYKDYFTNVGYVLPCKFCRDSYQKFIQSPPTELTDECMLNRDNLVKWFIRIHDAVNNKLDIKYASNCQERIDRFESMRAKCNHTDEKVQGCVTPLDYKALIYKKIYNVEAPIVDKNKIMPFIHLAKIRNIPHDYFVMVDLAIDFNFDYDKLKKEKSWTHRNNFCRKQMQYMRENGIGSVETSGVWFGCPTASELVLLLFLSTLMCGKELDEALANTINCIKKIEK